MAGMNARLQRCNQFRRCIAIRGNSAVHVMQTVNAAAEHRTTHPLQVPAVASMLVCCPDTQAMFTCWMNLSQPCSFQGYALTLCNSKLSRLTCRCIVQVALLLCCPWISPVEDWHTCSSLLVCFGFIAFMCRSPMHMLGTRAILSAKMALHTSNGCSSVT